MNTNLTLLLGLFLFSSLPAISQQQTVKPSPMTIQSVPLNFVSPSDVEPSITPLVEPDGRVTINRARNELVIMTTEEKMTTIRSLVESLDKMPLNVSIQVEMNQQSASNYREASVSGQGQVVIVNGKVQGQARINPRLQHREMGRTDNTMQSLLVMSGRGASLRVGEEIPYPDYIYSYGLRYGYISTGVQWQQVGSSLYVEPTVIGDGPLIRIRVTPEVRALVNGRLDSIRYAGAATEVMVQDGESVRIGGHGEHQDFYSKFLFGGSKGGSSSQLDIVLTPRIQPPVR